MSKRAYGFTIVELLIVIVVVAILAAISIVAYNGVSSKAHDSAVMADLNNFQKQLEVVKADLGRYPRTSSEFLDFKITRSAYDERQNNVYYVINTPEDSYALGVRSKSGQGYMLTRSGIEQRGTNAISGSVTAQAAGFSG